MALIFDTGPLIAYLDAGDGDHDRCRELIDETVEARLVPLTVLVEVEYHMRRVGQPSAFAKLLADFERDAFRLLEIPTQWLLRAGEVLEQYQDLGLGLVDASIVAATEMLSEPKVATLDHRHFTVVRPAHVNALTLLP